MSAPALRELQDAALFRRFTGEHAVSTEPITDQEVGYWFRSSPQRLYEVGLTPYSDIIERFAAQKSNWFPSHRTETQPYVLRAVVAEVPPQPSFDRLHYYAQTPKAPPDFPIIFLCCEHNKDEQSRQAGAPRTTRDPEWTRLYERLDSFRNLKSRWDGYSAEPPSTPALANASEFFHVLRAAGVKPFKANPSVVGGVGVTFRGNRRKVYAEFHNNGKLYVLFSDGESDPNAEAVDTGFLKYVQLISDIRNYLNAQPSAGDDDA